MSELKAFLARKIDDGTCDPVPCAEVYRKSEADAVIRHHKYKRCLAMAYFWDMKAAMLMVVRTGTNNGWYIEKYERRGQKWRDLAEKFKETK